MPICPNCEAFFPKISDLVNHRQEDCRSWTKSQDFSILMLQCDGTENTVANYEMRLELIEELVGLFGDGKKNDSVFRMLLAPEFFFWNELGSPKGVFSSDAATECFGALARLSARVGKILLVPGTIPIADSFAFGNLKLHYEHLKGVAIAPKGLLPGGVAREYLNEEWAGQLEYTLEAKKTFLYRNVLGGFYDSRQIIESRSKYPIHLLATSSTTGTWTRLPW